MEVSCYHPGCATWGETLQAQNKKAFRVLESVDGRLAQTPDNHEYYYALAASAAETGNKMRAKDAFISAFRAAKAANDTESAASASGGLAELLEEEGDWDWADDLLKKALATDVGNEHKAALLTQRFRMLLRAGRNRQAGSVFRQIQDLTTAAGLHEESVDAHMILGDHEWEHGKSKTKAMQAYIAALIPASAIGIEAMIQTGTHAMRRLLNLNVADRVQQIERMQRTLQRWLAKQVGADKQPGAEAIALWPLRIALRIARNPKDLSLSSTKRMTKLLEEEIFGV